MVIRVHERLVDEMGFSRISASVGFSYWLSRFRGFQQECLCSGAYLQLVERPRLRRTGSSRQERVPVLHFVVWPR